MRARRKHTRSRAGFTLVELVLAAGLMALLMIAVFGLIEGSLSLWRKSETRRNLSEQASGVASLLAHDLRGLQAGERGDLLVEWETFDTDGDGLKETCWPRLRFVRQASEAELARMDRTTEDEQPLGEDGLPMAASAPRLGPGLIEVCWAVVPLDRKDPDARAEGLIYRGVQRIAHRSTRGSDVGNRDSYFHDDFISSSGMPNTASLDEVTGGLLWFQPLLATQTSIVHNGWEIGGELQDAATAWDAWSSGRLDDSHHAWNVAGAGMPTVGDSALLPRRIRIELEFERAIDRRRRTRTLSRIELTDVSFQVDDERRLPKPGNFLKVDGEWMRVRSIRGNHLTVERGMRGTQAMIHDGGALVHWGLAVVREVPVDLYREDWNL